MNIIVLKPFVQNQLEHFLSKLYLFSPTVTVRLKVACHTRSSATATCMLLEFKMDKVMSLL